MTQLQFPVLGRSRVATSRAECACETTTCLAIFRNPLVTSFQVCKPTALFRGLPVFLCKAEKTNELMFSYNDENNTAITTTCYCMCPQKWALQLERVTRPQKLQRPMKKWHYNRNDEEGSNDCYYAGWLKQKKD